MPRNACMQSNSRAGSRFTQWLEVPGPGPGSTVPRSPLFWHKRSRVQGPAFWKIKKRSKVRIFKNWKKGPGPRSADLGRTWGPQSMKKIRKKRRKKSKSGKKKLLTSQKIQKTRQFRFFFFQGVASKVLRCPYSIHFSVSFFVLYLLLSSRVLSTL
jgi:hypothetical protein